MPFSSSSSHQYATVPSSRAACRRSSLLGCGGRIALIRCCNSQAIAIHAEVSRKSRLIPKIFNRRLISAVSLHLQSRSAILLILVSRMRVLSWYLALRCGVWTRIGCGSVAIAARISVECIQPWFVGLQPKVAGGLVGAVSSGFDKKLYLIVRLPTNSAEP